MHEHPNIDINLTVDTAPIIIEKVKTVRLILPFVIGKKGLTRGNYKLNVFMRIH